MSKTEGSPPGVPPPDAHLTEVVLGSEDVFHGKLLHVRRDAVRLPDGAEATREYIVHPGAVMIIPRLPDGKLLLERQYRYPLDRVFIEFPAGKVDPGEDRLAAAKRELTEETGYVAARWSRLAIMHPVISYSTEQIDIYLADELTQVGVDLDHGEFIETISASLDEALGWLDCGEITDSKTMIGLLLLARRPATQAARRGDVVRRLLIAGRVQGVGFRYALADEARALGLRGWVRNRRSGEVEAVVAGPAPEVEAIVAWARRGPPAASVTRFSDEAAAGEFDAFEIEPTV